MKVGVPKEIVTNECRVALAPDAVSKLVNAGIEVLVESGAGEAAFLPDDTYKKSGSTIVPDTATLFGGSDVILKVQRPVFNEAMGKEELDMMTEG